MPEDLYAYHKMLESALRGVAREALTRAAQHGLRGSHHFYLTFRTRAPGVAIPEFLVAKYPDEMTIVLQHQFWGLEVGPEGFAVSLSFQSNIERLSVPFAAMTAFADPSVDFVLCFKVPAEAVSAAAGSLPATLPEAAATPDPAAEPRETGSAEVVTLDQFRKR